MPLRLVPPLPQALISTTLSTVLRGKFCNAILPGRPAVAFEKGQVIYDIGDDGRNLLFILSGFAKVETLTRDGHSVIYGVRKAGDVVGELCAYERWRSNRAVALETTTLIAVPFDEVLEIIQKDHLLLRELVQVFCGALSNAYQQVDTIAVGDTMQKLTRALVRLGRELGRISPEGTEIAAHVTQEELAQMVGVSRERLSMAMNSLRAQGLADYSRGGRIVLDLAALEAHAERGADVKPVPAAARAPGK